MLYLFIDEIIFLYDAENFIPSSAKAKVSKKGKARSLKASISGDSTKKYRNLDHVKAATYSEMYIKKTKSCWEAQAVVDV